jgi:integrase
MPKPRSDGRLPRPTVRRRLTDRMIRSLVPDPARVDRIYDELQRGLAVFITPEGRKSFVLIYRHRNRNRWHRLGDAGIGVEAARKIAAKVLYQVAEGRDPQAERVADRRAGSFAELHRLYIDGHAKRFNKSWKQASALINNHVLPHLGRTKAASVTRSDVKTLLARIADRPILSNAVLAALSATFSWALAEEVGGVTANPCARIRRNETRSRERILSDAELKTLWPDLDPTLRLALLTGARMIELEHMRAEDVVDATWTMPGAPTADGRWMGTKNAATNKVPLSELAASFIGEHIAGRSRRRSEKLLRSLVARHGLPAITPHDLRRTFASWVAGHAGRDAMNRLLGHSDRGISSVYDRFEYLERDRATVAAIARNVLAIVDGVALEANVVPLRVK